MNRPTMLDYVHETPKIIIRQVKSEFHNLLAEEFVRTHARVIRIVASGSSRNAALLARHFIRRLLNVEVMVTDPYTFSLYEHELAEEEFCFVISQSGYSTNALRALSVIRASGKTAIGVTGDLSSDIKDECDLLVDYGVGEELVGYVTKGVSSLTSFLCLFAIGSARLLGRIDQDEEAELYNELLEVTGSLEYVSEQTFKVIQKRYKELTSMSCGMLIGSGPNYGVSCEGALKFGECIQFPAFAYELEEFIHGPNLQLTPGYSVFINAVGRDCWERATQIERATRLVTDHVFVLTDNPDNHLADICIPVSSDQLLAPLALLPFYQIVSFRVTDDSHLWYKHPLVSLFDKNVSGKSDNYVDKEVMLPSASNRE